MPTTPTEHAAPVSLQVVLAWALVGVPLAWGIYETVVKSAALFQ